MLLRKGCQLYVELEYDDVAVLHDVFLAFLTDRAALFCLDHIAAKVLEVVEGVPMNSDQITIAKAQEVYPDVQPGEKIEWEVTPSNFGRIAAQAAKQNLSRCPWKNHHQEHRTKSVRLPQQRHTI